MRKPTSVPKGSSAKAASRAASRSTSVRSSVGPSAVARPAVSAEVARVNKGVDAMRKKFKVR